MIGQVKALSLVGWPSPRGNIHRRLRSFSADSRGTVAGVPEVMRIHTPGRYWPLSAERAAPLFQRTFYSSYDCIRASTVCTHLFHSNATRSVHTSVAYLHTCARLDFIRMHLLHTSALNRVRYSWVVRVHCVRGFQADGHPRGLDPRGGADWRRITHRTPGPEQRSVTAVRLDIPGERVYSSRQCCRFSPAICTGPGQSTVPSELKYAFTIPAREPGTSG